MARALIGLLTADFRVPGHDALRDTFGALLTHSIRAWISNGYLSLVQLHLTAHFVIYPHALPARRTMKVAKREICLLPKWKPRTTQACVAPKDTNPTAVSPFRTQLTHGMPAVLCSREIDWVEKMLPDCEYFNIRLLNFLLVFTSGAALVLAENSHFLRCFICEVIYGFRCKHSQSHGWACSPYSRGGISNGR